MSIERSLTSPLSSSALFRAAPEPHFRPALTPPPRPLDKRSRAGRWPKPGLRPKRPIGDAASTLGGVPHRTVSDAESLREIVGTPAELVLAKLSDRLNALTRQFVERSPFVCVATASPDGGLDVSPRGDPAGFVRVLDERTLLLPERPGNRIADTLGNLLGDPRIALLFLIPGVGETFRVNGRGAIVDDPELLEPSAVDGKVPRLGILVSIEEAYTQCAKALIRADQWNPERHVQRSELPSAGEVRRSLIGREFDAAEFDRERAARYARGEGLY